MGDEMICLDCVYYDHVPQICRLDGLPIRESWVVCRDKVSDDAKRGKLGSYEDQALGNQEGWGQTNEI